MVPMMLFHFNILTGTILMETSSAFGYYQQLLKRQLLLWWNKLEVPLQIIRIKTSAGRLVTWQLVLVDHKVFTGMIWFVLLEHL